MNGHACVAGAGAEAKWGARLQLAGGVMHALEEEQQAGLEGVVVAEVQRGLLRVQRLGGAGRPALLEHGARALVPHRLRQPVLAPAQPRLPSAACMPRGI